MGIDECTDSDEYEDVRMVGKSEAKKYLVGLIVGEITTVSACVLSKFSMKETVVMFIGYLMTWTIITMVLIIIDKMRSDREYYDDIIKNIKDTERVVTLIEVKKVDKKEDGGK